jgi:ADP-ribose pyrophosphatase
MSNEMEKTVLYDGRYVRLVKRGNWEFVERKKISGIVGIVALTDERKLILVEQLRVPLQKNVIELPAGLAGDVAGEEDEALANAAARELDEETGYSAERMEYLCEGASSAGITTEIITLFRATGLKKSGGGGGDGTENITVHEIPVKEIDAWLAARAKGGAVIDLKVYAGLRFVERS